MDLIDPKIIAYAESHSEPESALLQKINRDTHAQVLMPRMLSGHLQGRILAMVSAMIQPTFILEIGTYTGYSALCLAENLREHGKLISIENNEELESRIRHNWSGSTQVHQMELIIGDALCVIPTLAYTFDLVFIDADKKNYIHYFEMILSKVRKGGFIVADNVLWSGKVIYGSAKKDKDLESILAFNAHVQRCTHVKNVLLPIRDGLMLMQKI